MRRCFTIVCLALLLAGCSNTPTPPARTPLVASPTVPPVRTQAVVVRRGTPGLPTRGPATPGLPQTTPRAGAALIVQAVTALQERGLAAGQGDILYDAAYRGAVGALRRLGYLVEGDPPRFTNAPADDAARFTTAYLILAGASAVQINQTSLAYEAIRAATDRLDECHTYLLEPQEYQALQATIDQTGNPYVGVGISLQAGAGPPTIISVYPATPAARLDLRPGDTILTINGQAVAALPAEQVGALLRGSAGSSIELTIKRPGETAGRVVVLTRERVAVPPLATTITTAADGRRIGTIRLITFAPGSEQAFDQALAAFERANVVGWVLDLREAGGGSVETLLALAERFLDTGQTVAYRVRDGEAVPLNTAAPPIATPQRSLAIVINGGTREMPEAFAAALRDSGRARLFGEATAGCVSLTTVFALADGAALPLGVAQLVTPTRQPLAQVGQQPDETVWPRFIAAADPPLAAAQAWVAEQVK